jgi:argininosuccinate synthase
MAATNENAKKKVVLVYSGGLDTTVCIPLMKEEYGYQEIITVTVDVGQPAEDIQQAAEKAKVLGTQHFTVDAKDDFVVHYCFPALQANANYEGYPLSTSIARPLIAEKAVLVAREMGATCFAHGCTGKGNDQFRIEYAIRALMPEAVIHAPVREKNMTRVWEIDYALKKNLPIKQSLEKILSIDENHVVFGCYDKGVFDYCRSHGIEPILCDIRHRFFFDGSVHCCTLDIRRKGGMEDYYG